MDSMYVIKGQLQKVYAKYSKYIDKVFQFLLAWIIFSMINKDIGYMEVLANPLITFGLAAVCTIFPSIFTVLVAGGMILAHMYKISLAIAGVTAIIFLIMFVFYIKFSPKKAIIIMLMPVAFMWKIPFAMPIALGLTGSLTCVVPVACGTIVYYIVDYVKQTASTLPAGGEITELVDHVTAYVMQVFQNKEMWMVVVTFMVTLVVVYIVRRWSIDHAWKIAIAAGILMNILMVAGGSMVMDVELTSASLAVGNIAAIVIGLILEFVFFSVDYSRSESIQFEDDEYYYYVKVVPKIVVAAPEKTVKRINRREEVTETEVYDADEIRKRTSRSSRERTEEREPVKRTRSRRREKDMDQLLLTQSLREEFDLDK